MEPASKPVIQQEEELHVCVDLMESDLIATLMLEGIPPDNETLRVRIREELKKKKVVYGIKEEILDDVGSIRFGSKITIAEGEYPRHGIDGYVEFHSRAHDPGGPKLYPLNNVTKGKVIAVLYPPHEGKPGKTVRGRVIKQRIGKKARLLAGMGTKTIASDPLTVAADEDGHAVMHKDGRVEVKPIITIESDVNPTMGSIDFVGSLVVRGNVNSGSSISVGKDLMIIGHSRDAVINAGGDVWVREGFIGKGDGIIRAKGNVTLPHVWNQTVETDGNIELLRESVGGRLVAGGKIIADNATIVGGLLEASQEITVKNLGCGRSTQARIRVGCRSRTLTRLSNTREEIQYAKRHFKEIENSIKRLKRMNGDLDRLPIDQQGIHEKLKESHEFLTRRLAALKEEQARLIGMLDHDYDSRLKVHGIVRENVLVEVNGIRKVIDDELEGVMFKEREHEIKLEGVD
jgi:uncharacterized protein